MNALVVVDQPLPEDFNINPAVRETCVRLADEGVPVRAIARATKVAGEDVYYILKNAIELGYLVELPKDDWPPGSPRSSRHQLSGTILDNDDTLKFACARIFRCTRLEAIILSVLLKRTEVTKVQLHSVIEQNRPTENRDETDLKMVDVIICHLRKKLKASGIRIDTVWGIGYLIKPEHRALAVRLLTPTAEQATNGQCNS